MPCQEKQRYPSSNVTMRYNVSRITTQNQWSGKVLLDHEKVQWWIWPGTLVLLLQ